jgi:tetratricopeptide (TPR) repeat protein
VSENKEHQKEAKKLRKRLSKRKKLIVIGAVVILLIAIGLGVWFLIQSQKPKVTIIPRTTDQINQVVTDADTLASSGNIAGAKAAYSQAIDQTSDATQKSYLLISDASLYYEEGNYDQAIILAKQAESYKLDENVASMMAEIYKTKGDKQNAIVYYKKAIDLTDKTSEMNDNTLYYQNEIDVLNGVVK